ncbi:hypothetical protein DPMN_031035 [Dreissena polymorpha]|uniref:VWFA domain-containing protein n=1 Tax=Dreissena polymorpha TaxID=45954 RepID=A0A9D4RHN3_DREPO|nr:hypothetical protein DPMN_031035 [Dreissena polymorpha]
MVSNLIRQPSVIKRGEAVGQLRDLLIIVDSSGSIGLASFETAKTQLARLLGMLCPISDPFDVSLTSIKISTQPNGYA